MGQIKIQTCPIEGLCVIEPAVHTDGRGYFMETYNKRELLKAGLSAEFVQENQSGSKKGVLRGLHYQKQHPQGKIVRVAYGKIYDVAVDLRRESLTFGKWYGGELSLENKRQIYIPERFAHGFLVLSDYAEVCYQCTGFYEPGDEGGVAWNDPDIKILWPGIEGGYDGTPFCGGYRMKDGTPVCMSEKDQCWPRLKDIEIVNI